MIIRHFEMEVSGDLCVIRGKGQSGVSAGELLG